MFVLFASPVAAADYIVTPLALNLEVNKRDIISETVTLTNKSDRLVRIYASVNEVSVDGDGVVKSFEQPSRADRTITPTTWVEITRGRMEIKPGESKEVPFTIRMNPNTQPGKYAVFIGFASASNAPQAQAKVMAGDAPGTLLSLTVDKEQNAFLRLEKFIVDRFVTEEKGGNLSYTLTNPGRTDIVPKGELIFYDNSGNEVSSVPLNPENKQVTAEGTEGFGVAVPADLEMGKYKAFLSVEYGEHLTASVHDTAFFYIVPLKKLIAAFMILMILAVFIALFVHRRYDTEPALVEYDSVPMFVREGKSEKVHHDIDLKNKDS